MGLGFVVSLGHWRNGAKATPPGHLENRTNLATAERVPRAAADGREYFPEM